MVGKRQNAQNAFVLREFGRFFGSAIPHANGNIASPGGINAEPSAARLTTTKCNAEPDENLKDVVRLMRPDSKGFSERLIGDRSRLSTEKRGCANDISERDVG